MNRIDRLGREWPPWCSEQGEVADETLVGIGLSDLDESDAGYEDAGFACPEFPVAEEPQSPPPAASTQTLTLVDCICAHDKLLGYYAQGYWVNGTSGCAAGRTNNGTNQGQRPWQGCTYNNTTAFRKNSPQSITYATCSFDVTISSDCNDATLTIPWDVNTVALPPSPK